MNRVNLTGRLTSNPELRVNQNGSNICRFALAVARKYKNAMGEYDSDFIHCVAFNKTADTVNKYVQKGDLLGVEGKIQTGSYTANDGSKRYTTDVVVDGIDFLQTKKAKKEQNSIEKEQETVENEQKDVFADFGENVEIDDNFLE